MTRTTSGIFVVLLLSPSVARADVIAEPRYFLTTSEWVVAGSIVLGVILAGFAVKKLKSDDCS